jgi:hypothetical protein
MDIRSFAEELILRFRELKIDDLLFAEQTAKSHNYNQKRKLVDQYMWGHIETGAEALVSLIEYGSDQGVTFNQQEIQIALVGYALHDLHKNRKLKDGSTSEYDLDLKDLEEVCQQLCSNLNLPEVPPATFIRAAGISNYSGKHGDRSFLSDEYRWSAMLDWVKLMDKTASITSIAEVKEKNNLAKLEKALRQVFPPSYWKLEVHYHWIPEMRGVLTTQLHNGFAAVLLEKGHFPWLRFGDGTVYLSLEPKERASLPELSRQVTHLLRSSLEQVADAIAKEELFDRSTLECNTLAFLLFQKPKDYAGLFYELFAKPSDKAKTFPEANLKETDIRKYGVESHQKLWKKMNITREWEEDLQEKWYFTARYFAALQRLIQKVDRSLSLPNALQKIAEFFQLPFDDLLQLEPVIKCSNRRYDGHIWLSYRWLDTCKIDGKPIQQISLEDYRLEVKRQAKLFLQNYISPSITKGVVDARLGINQELEGYIQEQVVLSWDQTPRTVADEKVKELYKEKNRSHQRRCNICNRPIIPKVDEKVKDAIIHDHVNVFSNRLLPKEKEVPALHWCGVCAFEFILRQASNVSLRGNKENTKQIYLFAVPSYQFTSEVIVDLERELDDHFGTISVHPNHGMRHAWQKPFVEGNNEDIRDHIREHFRLYSEYVREQGQLNATGDVLSAGPIGNFMFFSFQSYSYSDSPKMSRTREEGWLKALSAALSLHFLYGFRIYLTEKPFLSLTDLREFRYAIHLDSPPHKITKLLESVEDRGTTDYVVPIEFVLSMMHRLAYVWEIHRFLHPFELKKPIDKQVSSILHEREVNPLCGAYFFKRYMTNATQVKAPSSLVIACENISKEKGRKWMDLVEEIAHASLALFFPSNQMDGRAYRFENLFRTVVKGIREGMGKSALNGLVLKRLERLVRQGGGKVVELPIPIDKVTALVDLIYERFYLQYCSGNLFTLIQKQNAVADGIYFETYKAVQAAKEARASESKAKEDAEEVQETKMVEEEEKSK